MELVHTTTSDQLRLDGLWQAPTSGSDQAVLLLHGVGGTFYGTSLLSSIGQRLLESGYGVLRANTRGHDVVSLAQVQDRFRFEGAAFEQLSRCPRDIAAWLALMSERGVKKSIVIGHSLGALKAVYAAAHDPAASPDILISLSPPQLSYTKLMNGPERESFAKTMEQAQQHVQQARYSELMQVKTPVPMIITAATYVDKYGPEEHYNFANFAHLVNCPSYYIYGELELTDKNAAFSAALSTLKSLPFKTNTPDFEIISGANHFYHDRFDEVTQAVLEWLSASK